MSERGIHEVLCVDRIGRAGDVRPCLTLFYELGADSSTESVRAKVVVSRNIERVPMREEMRGTRADSACRRLRRSCHEQLAR